MRNLKYLVPSELALDFWNLSRDLNDEQNSTTYFLIFGKITFKIPIYVYSTRKVQVANDGVLLIKFEWVEWQFWQWHLLLAIHFNWIDFCKLFSLHTKWKDRVSEFWQRCISFLVYYKLYLVYNLQLVTNYNSSSHPCNDLPKQNSRSVQLHRGVEKEMSEVVRWKLSDFVSFWSNFLCILEGKTTLASHCNGNRQN